MEESDAIGTQLACPVKFSSIALLVLERVFLVGKTRIEAILKNIKKCSVWYRMQHLVWMTDVEESV